MTVSKYIIAMHDGNKNNFKNNVRIIEVQIVQKLKYNEPRPKFTGSYKKMRVVLLFRL